MIEARGRIPADGAVPRRARRPPARLERSHGAVRRDVRPLLPPPAAGRPGRRVDPLPRLRPCRVPWRQTRSGRARRPLAPAGRAVTLRAIVGLVALNAGFAVAGALRFSTRCAASRAGRTSSGSQVSATSSVSPPSASSGRSCSSSASRSAAGGSSSRSSAACSPPAVAGRALRPPAAPVAGGARPRRRSRSSSPPLASRSSGSCSRRSSARPGCRACRPSTRGRSGCRRRRRSTSSAGSTSRCSRPRPARPTRRSCRSSTRRPSTRWGARTSSRSISSSGSCSSAAVAALAGCLCRHVPAWLLWPSLLVVLVAPRFGERLLDPAGGHARRRPLRRRRRAARALARRRPRLAARRGRRAPRGRDADEARGPPVRRHRARSRLRCLVGPCGRRAWAALGSGRARRRRRRPSPGGSGTARRTSSGEAPADARQSTRAPIARSTRSASRSRCSSTRRSGRSSRSSCSLRSRSPSSGATDASRRTSRSSSAIAFLGGAWVTYSYADLAITANEALNPIVRYTGAIVVLAAGAMPLLARLGLAHDRAGRRTVTHRTAVLVAAAIVAVPLLGYPALVRRRRRPLPVAPTTASSVAAAGRREGLDLVFGRRDTPAEAEVAARAGSGRGLRRRRAASATAARAGKCSTTGIESYEQGLESRAEARGAGLQAELELEPA